MKTIPLTQGYEAIVDDGDYDRIISMGSWHVVVHKNFGIVYANRNITLKNRTQRNIYMHRIIMDAPDGMCVDHINRVGLDNRKQNLRLCTHAENMRNRGVHRNSSSSFKGVSWHKRDKIWNSNIRVNGKQKHIGYFDNEIEAAKAYDRAATEMHGEFARLNFPEDHENGGKI